MIGSRRISKKLTGFSQVIHIALDGSDRADPIGRECRREHKAEPSRLAFASRFFSETPLWGKVLTSRRYFTSNDRLLQIVNMKFNEDLRQLAAETYSIARGRCGSCMNFHLLWPYLRLAKASGGNVDEPLLCLIPFGEISRLARPACPQTNNLMRGKSLLDCDRYRYGGAMVCF